jgi:glycosyltransferase involved in cell wall biosynthesis
VKRKLLYLGNFSFPYNSAAGSRVLGNGYLLRHLGYDVIYIGLDKDLPVNSKLSDTQRVYDDFKYFNIPYPKGVTGWLLYKKRFNEVISLVESEDLDTVIIYGSPTISLFMLLVRNWCRKNKIKFISDCVDWLPAGSGGLYFRFAKAIDTLYQMRFLNSSADGIIAISSFMSDFYKSKGCPTVIIPPLVDIRKYSHLYNRSSNNEAINLIYVGQPFPVDGRKVNKISYKDRLDKVIESLYQLRNHAFIFNIYGLTKQQYISVLKKHTEIVEDLGDKLKFHGHIVNSEAIVRISDADFLILFRDVNRMTKSGFPTKVVESITCGTPVIVNDTSDLKKYIKEGINGFVIDILDREKMVTELRKILLTNRQTISWMKKNCEEAELFSYHNYVSDMNSFMNFVKSN